MVNQGPLLPFLALLCMGEKTVTLLRLLVLLPWMANVLAQECLLNALGVCEAVPALRSVQTEGLGSDFEDLLSTHHTTEACAVVWKYGLDFSSSIAVNNRPLAVPAGLRATKLRLFSVEEMHIWPPKALLPLLLHSAACFFSKLCCLSPSFHQARPTSVHSALCFLTCAWWLVSGPRGALF